MPSVPTTTIGRATFGGEFAGRGSETPGASSRLEHGDFLQFSIEERGYPVNAPQQPVCRVSWDDAMTFALGDELDGQRGFIGLYRLVAVYSRALTDKEIVQLARDGPSNQQR